MKVSVICPFYNEENILQESILSMTRSLKRLDHEWELILVNDGSLDGSLAIAEAGVSDIAGAAVISYSKNMGRGHALAQGIKAAVGDILVTTEIDLSWGEDIVEKIIEKFINEPDLDAVVASPNLPGGSYQNVPFHRVFLSKFGNSIIRLFFTTEVTMNTGMTRGYKSAVIKALHFSDKGKEFHLEVLFKLTSLGYRIGEIPATLKWTQSRVNERLKKGSGSVISTVKLILSHLNFAVFANPMRYFWAISFFCSTIGVVFIADAFYRLFTGGVAIYMALAGFSMLIIGILFFGFGIVSNQNNYLLREIWTLKRDFEKEIRSSKSERD